ncbi:hypothetical protein NL676_011742 [Syzygium grande]|nr:hypothetical protein NL676_011742 [Syzygium grande]
MGGCEDGNCRRRRPEAVVMGPAPAPARPPLLAVRDELARNTNGGPDQTPPHGGGRGRHASLSIPQRKFRFRALRTTKFRGRRPLLEPQNPKPSPGPRAPPDSFPLLAVGAPILGKETPAARVPNCAQFGLHLGGGDGCSPPPRRFPEQSRFRTGEVGWCFGCLLP